MNEITERVRTLRWNMTSAERVFWEAVRYRKLGTTFHRQKPLRFMLKNKPRYFIADFMCKEHKLVIEIDGKIHESQQEYDEARTYVINALGYKVIRFTNDQIFNNLQDCINEIKLYCLPSEAREGGIA